MATSHTLNKVNELLFHTCEHIQSVLVPIEINQVQILIMAHKCVGTKPLARLIRKTQSEAYHVHVPDCLI